MWTGVNRRRKLCEPVQTVVRTYWKSGSHKFSCRFAPVRIIFCAGSHGSHNYYLSVHTNWKAVSKCASKLLFLSQHTYETSEIGAVKVFKSSGLCGQARDFRDLGAGRAWPIGAVAAVANHNDWPAPSPKHLWNVNKRHMKVPIP
jgi:hypothetical protein